MAWKFRHWLAARFLKVAIVIFPESPAKDNLCRALGAWGRNTPDQLAATASIPPDLPSAS
jgi:hypothetical protein